MLIDCPPNLGLLTVNAIVAAREVLVPVNMTDEGALQGAYVLVTIPQSARATDRMELTPYGLGRRVGLGEAGERTGHRDSDDQ